MGALVIGCAGLLVIGCSGTRSEAPQEEGQGHTEATKKEQTRPPEATASEEARCEGTRTFQKVGPFTTNDLPGCPKDGLLLGTDKPDKLDGKKGDDEIRGLGASDFIFGGVGNDVIYAGPGDDMSLYGDEGDDVIYGGDGDDGVEEDKGADVIYGGASFRIPSRVPCSRRPSRWASGHRLVRNALLRASPQPCCSDPRPQARRRRCSSRRFHARHWQRARQGCATPCTPL